MAEAVKAVSEVHPVAEVPKAAKEVVGAAEAVTGVAEVHLVGQRQGTGR